jgi:hypothetical protein
MKEIYVFGLSDIAFNSEALPLPDAPSVITRSKHSSSYSPIAPISSYKMHSDEMPISMHRNCSRPLHADEVKAKSQALKEITYEERYIRIYSVKGSRI